MQLKITRLCRLIQLLESLFQFYVTGKDFLYAYERFLIGLDVSDIGNKPGIYCLQQQWGFCLLSPCSMDRHFHLKYYYMWFVTLLLRTAFSSDYYQDVILKEEALVFPASLNLIHLPWYLNRSQYNVEIERAELSLDFNYFVRISNLSN
jgi:hypothetical protein